MSATSTASGPNGASRIGLLNWARAPVPSRKPAMPLPATTCSVRDVSAASAGSAAASESAASDLKLLLISIPSFHWPSDPRERGL